MSQENKLELQGIFKEGYGVVAKLVMKDQNLDIEAKGLYAYLCSYAGSGNTCFPSVDLICDHLNISKKRFYKYRQQLIEQGYITVKENRDAGKINNNTYIIEPCSQIAYMQNAYTQNAYMEFDHTNNNSINNNSSNNNNSNNKTSSKEDVCRTEVRRIIDAWNSLGLTQIKAIKPNTNRYKLLRARLKEYGASSVLEAIDNVKQSSFLKGQNPRGWVITFDWFLRPNNFLKVLEGNYNDKPKVVESDRNKKPEPSVNKKPSRILQRIRDSLNRGDELA